MAQRLTLLLVLVLVLAAGSLACAARTPAAQGLPPTAPLPTAGMAGQIVAVTPLTLLAADDQLPWREVLLARRAGLDRADSVIGTLLAERSPEVTWVLPPALRRAAARAPGMLTNPDQLGTAVLRDPGLTRIPDPLRSQLRALAGVAGGRYVLVPAALLYRPGDVPGQGRAELVLLLADVRTGLIGWRTVAHAEADDPWVALAAAVRSLVPGLP